MSIFLSYFSAKATKETDAPFFYEYEISFINLISKNKVS